MELKKDERTISPEELKQRPHACRLKLDEVLHLFVSPDTGMPLRLSDDGLTLTDDEHVYDIRDGLPILMPTKLVPFLLPGFRYRWSITQIAFCNIFYWQPLSNPVKSMPHQRKVQPRSTFSA